MSSAAKHPVTIRPPESLHERLAEAASWLGISLNTFVLQAAAERADAVLERKKVITLSEEDARMIVDLLDNPPEPTPALKKAFESHRRLFSEA
jgi:uncharacterized protein (DUF1778 family)